MAKVKTFYNIHSLQKRFIAVLIAIVIIFVCLVGRFGFLQLIQGNELQVKACNQWFRDLPLKAERGTIYDANGVVLAGCETTYDVYVRARSVKEPVKVANALCSLLGSEYNAAYKKATNTLISESLVKLSVDEDTALQLVNLNLDGIYLSQSIQRVYPYSNLLTQVLGFTTIDSIGQAGLEAYYEKFLKGINGKSLVQSNAQGKEIESSLAYYIPGIKGADLHTTIDVQVQSILEQALETAYHNHNAKATTGIIIDAETGGIVAMSNKPSFDLNEIPRDDVALLNALTKNTTVVDIYEPGSTFKIFTLLAALNEGLTALDDRFYCTGSCSVDGQKIKCWKTKGHGSQNLIEGFKNSCNCVFVTLALKLGVERLYKYLSAFGVCEKTGVDIFSESGGMLMNKSAVTNNDLARIGFGHTIALSPLNMLTSVANAVTNHSLKPYIVDYMSANGKIVYKNNSVKSSSILKQETVDILRRLLRININGYDEKLTFVPGYDIGGKTGTAQKYENGVVAQGKYVSSFVGVYPANSPKYVMLVTVDEPQGAYYGSIVASPIAKEVFAKIFEVKNIPPDDLESYALTPNIIMPDIIGMPLAQAGSLLVSLGLSYELDGEGDYVVGQLPLANEKLFKDETVLVVTNG